MSQQRKVLEMRDIHVSYEAVIALDGVDFDLYSGEIHGVIGEHRAGKSTLVKVLSGATSFEKGTVVIDEEPVPTLTPKTSRSRGIGVVYQDLSIIPHLDAVENVFTGHMLRRGLRALDRKEMERRTKALLDSINCDISLQTPVSRLKRANQHMVELARALVLDPRILVLDDLSNKLTPEEMQPVYRALFERRERGCAVVYIGHDMEEILRLADRVTVLKSGHRLFTNYTKGLDKLRLFELTYSFRLDELRTFGGDSPLRRLARDLQNVIQVLPVGVVLVDAAGTVQLYNLAAAQLCSFPSASRAIDRPLSDLVASVAEDGGIGAGVDESIKTLTPFQLDELRLRSGKSIRLRGVPVPSSVGPAPGAIVVIEDVSLDRYVTDYVVENAKMSTVAQLAVGVAHEINNPLFAIQNYLEIIRTRTADADIENRLESIEREISRITEIVSSLLSFSRINSSTAGSLDVREVLENVVILLQHAFREKNVTVDLTLSPEPLFVRGSENRLTQVFLNLIANAVDAVLSAGRIAIEARLEESSIVTVRVTDNGCGIPPETQGRIFEPFFTTKLSRQNTGLGLSICRNILEEHRGTIAFTSRPGFGTTFTVRLSADPVPSSSDVRFARGPGPRGAST